MFYLNKIFLSQEDTRKEEDLKAEHRFSEVMSDKNEAVSDFAKRRTFAQQRQYLPIYAVRNEVCAAVIRKQRMQDLFMQEHLEIIFQVDQFDSFYTYILVPKIIFN